MDIVEKGQPGPPHDPVPRGDDGRRLRIAVLIGSLGPGGAEGVVARLAGAWARGGDDVAVVTLAPRSQDFFALDPAVRRVALDLAGDSASKLAATAANARRIAALRATLRSDRPDVAVSFVDRTNLLVLAAATGLGVPVVVCERTDPTRHVLGQPWTALRRVLYRRASAVVVQHEGLRSWAATVTDPARVLVLPNPVIVEPDADAGVAPADASRRIVGVGRFSAEKGFDRLIDAFSRIAGRLPGWTLLLTGDGPERARLEAAIAASGLGGRVIVRVPTPEPWQGARPGDVFVLPSRYEGMSNALLEAMARGLAPVVTPEAGGLHGVVRDGESALVASDGGAAALASAIERLATDEPLRTAIAAAARRAARRFALPEVAAQWRAAVHASMARHGVDRSS